MVWHVHISKIWVKPQERYHLRNKMQNVYRQRFLQIWTRTVEPDNISLPDNIRQFTNIQKFKKELKMLLFWLAYQLATVIYKNILKWNFT